MEFSSLFFKIFQLKKNTVFYLCIYFIILSLFYFFTE